MFSVKLNAPVLLRKQLPMIAEALHVDEKVLEAVSYTHLTLPTTPYV